MESGLANKTVLVTGGSGGIGQAIVRTMVQEGANVVIQYFSGKERAETLLASLGDSATATIAFADLTRESDVAQLYQHCQKDFGTVDVLIANAGKWPEPNEPIHEMSLDRWQATWANNSTSVFLSVREFIKRAAEAKIADPAIVITGSTAGSFGEANHADYAAAKSSFMYGLIRSVKNELVKVAPRGRINAVCPGWTLTEMARSLTSDPSSMKKTLQTIALRKFASSYDIANAVTFLASNRLAGHITGQTLFVDGGMEGRILHHDSDIDLQTAIPKYV